MYRQFAEWMTTSSATVVWCTATVLIGAYMFFRLWLKLREPRRELARALEVIEGVEPGTLAARFEDLDRELDSLRWVGPAWREFRRTLVLRPVADEPILQTDRASRHFAPESVIGERINLRLFGAVPGILTGLGILGTFVGLAFGIYLANLGLESPDIEQVKGALVSLLAGASLAFWTSIIGMLSSLVYMFIERNLIGSTGRSCEHLASAFDTRFPLVTAERLAADQLEQQKEQTRQLKRFNSDLAVSIAEALDDRVAGRLSPALDRLIDAVDGMRADRGESNERLLVGLVEEFKRTMSGAAGTEFSAMAQTLGELRTALDSSMAALQHGQDGMVRALGVATAQATAAFVEQVQTASEAMVAPVAQSTERLADVTARLEAVMKGWKDVALSSSQMIGRMDQVTRSMDGSVAALTSVSGSLGKTAESLSLAAATSAKATETSAATANRLEQAAAGVQSSMTTAAHAWAEYERRFAQTDRALAGVFQQLDEGLQRYSAQVREYLLELDRHLAKATGDLGSAIQPLGEDIQELPGLVSRLAKTMELVPEQVNRLATTLRAFADRNPPPNGARP